MMSLQSQVIVAGQQWVGLPDGGQLFALPRKGCSDFWLQALRAAYWLVASNSMDLCKTEPTISAPQVRVFVSILKDDGGNV